MKEHIALILPADLKYIRLASSVGVQIAEVICSQADIPDKDQFCHAFDLAISEAFANSVKHRVQEEETFQVNVEFQINEDHLSVIIKDKNPCFSKKNAPPDLDAHPENGYGLYLIEQFMDKVEHERQGDWNVITLTKNLPCPL